jgi:trehalose-phosphatase
LDYDGTLTPIAQEPKLARLSFPARKAIRNLSSQKEIKVSVISGRSLFDLKRLVRIPGITYAGNHGFEIEGPEINHVHPGALDAAGLLREIAARLKKGYRSTAGIFVENKKFTLSVHYRQLDVQNIGFSKALLLNEIAPYLAQSQVVLTEGKKVWEIRPALQWTKGETVMWLYARALAHAGKRVYPVYVGDDQTDEAAFKALKHQGLTVKVMENPREFTNAEYRLSSPDEVLELLEKIKKLKTREPDRKLK